MAKRKTSDGLPKGAYTCLSEGPDTDTICYDTDEMYGLLGRLAHTAQLSP
jgi:hypothetical protein